MKHVYSYPASCIAVILAGLVLGGCGTSQPVSVNYHDGSNTTTYQSRNVNTGHSLSAGSYGSSRTIELRADADCTGVNCKPDRARVSFMVAGSGNPVRFPDRSLKIITDENQHEHSDTRRRDAQESGRVGRHLMTFEVDFEDFEDFAHSEKFEVTLGTHTFSLSHDRRAPFRALVDATDGITADEDA